jgi:hypothetical protein
MCDADPTISTACATMLPTEETASSSKLNNTFIGDKPIEVAYPTNVAQTKQIMNLTNDPRYLNEKWVLLSTATVDISSQQLYITNTIDSSTMSGYFPNLYFLGKGAYGFRCTLRFRLEIAANPFIGAFFNLSFLPEYVTGDFPRYNYPATAHQLPSVNINLADTNVAELVIPYVHRLDYLPFLPSSSYPWSLGCLALRTSSASTYAVGSNTLTVNIRGCIEDLELIGNSTVNFANVAFQSGLSPTDIEKRTISNNFSAASTVASLLSGIPLIGSFAGNTAWALRFMAKTAYAFGYSKPNSVPPRNIMCETVTNRLQNFDGPTVCDTLALASDNTVALLTSDFGTTIDEMSFESIISRESYICNPIYSTADAYGKVIYAVPLCPLNLFYSRTGTAAFPNTVGTINWGKSFIPSNLFYIANLFDKWRGGFRFKFTVVATKYHVGKLLLSYLPNVNNFNALDTMRSPTISYTNALTFDSMIWDISTSSSVVFEIPYLGTTDYLATTMSFGSLSVQVLDKLSCPSTCGTTVSIVVTVSGMDDFEFACPSQVNFATAPIGSTVQYQSLAAERCMGERITSVKQLINIAKPIQFDMRSMNAFQWFLNPSNLWSATATDVPGLIIPIDNYGTYFAPAYLYARGSTRWSVVHLVDSYTTAFASFLGNVSGVVGFNNVVEKARAYHFILPSYFRRSKQKVTYDAARIVDPETIFARLFSVPLANYNVPYSNVVYMGAGDDSQLGRWLGPPPLALKVVQTPAGLGFTTQACNPIDAGFFKVSECIPPTSTTSAYPHYVAPPAALAASALASFGVVTTPSPSPAPLPLENEDPHAMHTRMVEPHEPIDIPKPLRYRNVIERSASGLLSAFAREKDDKPVARVTEYFDIVPPLNTLPPTE